MKTPIELVRNSNEILESISKIRSLKDGFLTNFYPDFYKIQFWMEEKLLFKAEYNHSVFYLRKQDTFYYLLYISKNLEALGPDLEDFLSGLKFSLVVEIISQKENDEILSLFKSKKFTVYAMLARLVMKTPEIYSNDYPENIKNATIEELQYIVDKLHYEFDKYSEQLPTLKELKHLIERGFVLIYKKETEIAGFIILEISGVTQHLRYWFVDPKFRNLKVGSSLFNAFLILGKETKRQILWCRTDNYNALKRYEHYGYKMEQMFDHVIKMEL